MRVLLYIEPHPIRNTLTHFNDIARKFLPHLRAGSQLDVRMFANAETFNLLGELIKPHEARLIRSTPEEEQLFAGYKVDWETSGIPIWLDSMAGRGAVTETYVNVLERIWARFPFDVIIHWGENGAISRFVKTRHITRIAMELGCTRLPFVETVVMDPFGTNGSGVVPRLSVADLKDITGGETMSAQEAMMAYSENTDARPYEYQFQPLPPSLAQRLNPGSKIAFFPLQLFDDANLLHFSPYKTLSDVVLDTVPKLVAQGYKVLITPHPSSKHRPNGMLANIVARVQLQEWADSIIWYDERDPDFQNARAIAISDVVVTVNSSVGFEALYFDKPVVVLGDAVYKPRDLFPTLDQFLAGDFDHAAYLENIGYLRRFFLGGYLQPAQIRQDVGDLERMIWLISRLHSLHGGDAVAFARDYWQANAPVNRMIAESVAFAGVSIAGQQEFAAPAIRPAQPVEMGEVLQGLGALPWLSITRRLMAFSRTTAPADFADWLDAQARSPAGLATLVSKGGFVDDAYYLDLHADVRRVGVSPVSHFIRRGFSECRSPQLHIPGTTLDDTLKRLKQAAELAAVLPPPAVSSPATEGAEVGQVIESLPWLPITRRLMAVSRTTAPANFADWLDAQSGSPTGLATLVSKGGLVDDAYYLRLHADVRKAGVSPVSHFINHGLAEGRSPQPHIPGTTLGDTLKHLKQAAELASAQSMLTTFPLEADEEARRSEALTRIGKALGKSKNRIAVVAHLYYRDIVPEFLERLKMLPETFDLIVTLPDWGFRKIEALVRADWPDAHFYHAANRGRDIGPFVDLLPILLERNYDAVFKVQTKRGYYQAGKLRSEFGALWREETLGALLGSKARVAEILRAFREDPMLNMIGTAPHFLGMKEYPYHDKGALAQAILRNGEAKGFFAGTMFWLRPDCLRPLAEQLGLKITSFAPETGANDGALAHLVERVFGHAAVMGDGCIAGAPVDPAAPLEFDLDPLGVKMHDRLTDALAIRQAAGKTATKVAL